MEGEERYAMMIDKQAVTDPDEVVEGLKDMGMKDSTELPDWIDEETFDQPLVRDLMTHISEGVVVLEREQRRPWMNPTAAVHMLDGSMYDVDGVTKRMRGTFLT
jgi:hypothetical protein